MIGRLQFVYHFKPVGKILENHGDAPAEQDVEAGWVVPLVEEMAVHRTVDESRAGRGSTDQFGGATKAEELRSIAY